jgi:4-oxalocrotonate tautomerase
MPGTVLRAYGESAPAAECLNSPELRPGRAAAEALVVHLQPGRKDIMPFVNVKVIEGAFDADQKKEIVRKLTDTMVSIEGEALRGVTWVVVEEVLGGDWGIGGQPLTGNDVKKLAAGQA